MGILNKLFGKTEENESYKMNQTSYTPEFEKLTELSQIASIFEWVFNPKTSIAIKSAETIHRLLYSQTAFKNKTLYNSLKYISLRKSDLKKFNKFDSELKQSLFCIASMNNSGYVREEALNQLSINFSANTFPYVLFRLADWVPTVKNNAENIVRLLMSKTQPELLIKHHKIIDWLLKVQRNDLLQIHNEITNFIFTEENVTIILNTINVYSEGDRYYIFKNLISKDLLNTEILETILTDKNFLIRLLAVRNIKLIDNPEILKILLLDRSQKIRQYSIQKIPKSKIQLYKEELHSLIFDNSSSLRLKSRFLLDNIDDINYYDIYLKKTLENPSIGSIIGLSEVGTIDDVPLFVNILNSKIAKHRASALFSISNLDYNQAKELAFSLLNDESNTVKKNCVLIIQKEKYKQDLIKLREIYKNGNIDTKRYSLKTIYQYGGWSISGDFLIGLSESDKKLNAISLAYLNAWYNYTIRLGTEQKKEDREYVLNILEKSPIEIKEQNSHLKFIFREK